MSGMSSGQALVHLIRMRDMKQHRLESDLRPVERQHFLRADIAALNYAIHVMECLQAEGTLSEYARGAGR